MGLRNPKDAADTRMFPRYLAVRPDFGGRLTLKASDLPATVIDVSREGLGVLMTSPVRSGEVVELHCEGRKIPMAVIYCVNDLIHPGAYRCGLRQAQTSRENLIALFKAAGWLDEKGE